MFCNNVSVLCNHMIVTGYVLIAEVACNKLIGRVFCIIILYCRPMHYIMSVMGFENKLDEGWMGGWLGGVSSSQFDF